MANMSWLPDELCRLTPPPCATNLTIFLRGVIFWSEDWFISPFSPPRCFIIWFFEICAIAGAPYRMDAGPLKVSWLLAALAAPTRWV